MSQNLENLSESKTITKGSLREALVKWIQYTQKNNLSTFKSPEEWADKISDFLFREII